MIAKELITNKIYRYANGNLEWKIDDNYLHLYLLIDHERSNNLNQNESLIVPPKFPSFLGKPKKWRTRITSDTNTGELEAVFNLRRLVSKLHLIDDYTKEVLFKVVSTNHIGLINK